MTIVVYWRTGRALQVLADTRISGGDRVYTDAGPKILLINMQSRTSSRDTDVRRRTFGFAFAGSSLAALSAYGVVSNCLANLVRYGSQVFPAVFDVGTMMAEAANRYISESQPPAPSLIFEGVVFGACEKENRIVSVAIDPTQKDGRWMAQAERTPVNSDNVIGILGQSNSFLRRVNQWQAEGRGFDPHGVIDEMIADPEEPTVGGSRQLALSGTWDVEVIPVAVPDGSGPKLKTLVAGIDASTLPNLDGFAIGYMVHMGKR